MNIDKQLLDNLTVQTQASPRLRMNFDLRDSVEEQSKRMQNALESGTVILEMKDGAYEPIGEEDLMRL